MIKYLFILILPFCIACTTANQLLPTAAVSTATPEATQAGQKILSLGGNAIDASIAIAFALNVSEPAMSGIGGGMQIIYSKVGEAPMVINGTTLSPSVVHVDSISGIRRSTIPSAVRTLYWAHQHLGSGKITWSQCIQPAIKLALQGFEIGPFRALIYQKYCAKLKENASSYLINHSACPQEGDTLKLPKLAKTLQLIANQGDQVFYQGEIADGITRDMLEFQGWISKKDLATFPAPKISKPLSISFRKDYQVYTVPPPAGGWVMLHALSQLDSISAEILKKPYSRFKELATSFSGAHEKRKSITGHPKQFDEEINRYSVDETGETTHFSVMDSDGMMVGVTASINAYFGAGIESKEYGFLYNSYMDDFKVTDSLDKYYLKSSSPAYSSMSPTIVQRGNKNKLVIGSPGSARIISTTAQLIQLWVDQPDLSLKEVLAFPRIHTIGSRVYLEEMDSTLITELEAISFKITKPNEDLIMHSLNPYFGGVHAISNRDNLEAAADPRRDGTIAILKSIRE